MVKKNDEADAEVDMLDPVAIDEDDDAFIEFEFPPPPKVKYRGGPAPAPSLSPPRWRTDERIRGSDSLEL